MCLCTWCQSARQVHLPVIKGTADDRVLSRLQHHVTSYELLHRALAVRQQTSQDQLIPVPKRGPEDHDAQIQQVTVGRVRTPGGVTQNLCCCCFLINISCLILYLFVCYLPAALLEEGKLQRGSLQDREGGDGHRFTRPAGEAALQTNFLPIRMNLADIHRIEVPAHMIQSPQIK